ncbi:hypothetical protein [Mesorhizobium sp. M0060]|uniref:hypothetical protein n=1 Tax=Mesorhizobium sp. M0060 TaxID=2956866 RepID=UPI0033371AEB
MTFKYDVAFSFHSVDENLVVALNDLLQDRFKTFLYSEQQKVLGGTDGEQTFNAVFGEQARIVAVFYRDAWGKTPFTRIEETAIRNRAFAEGFDFTVFIPTEKPASTPKWLPRPRLYLGLERFGLDGAAAVIETRIQEAGGEPSQETIEDRGKRFQRASELRSMKDQFRKSDTGVKAATAAFAAFVDAMKKGVEATGINASFGDLRGERDFHLLRLPGVVATIQWRLHYANDLEGSELVVEFHNGMPKLSGMYNAPSMRPVRRLAASKYDFGLIRPDFSGYVDRDHEGSGFDPEALVETILKRAMDLGEANPRP